MIQDVLYPASVAGIQKALARRPDRSAGALSWAPVRSNRQCLNLVCAIHSTTRYTPVITGLSTSTPGSSWTRMEQRQREEGLGSSVLRLDTKVQSVDWLRAIGSLVTTLNMTAHLPAH